MVSSLRGFTLVELTIVMVIIALLVGGMLVPLSAQRDIQNTRDTEKQLSETKEALYGFAAVNGRLPCPATATSAGKEAFCTEADGTKPCGLVLVNVQTHGRCADFFNGFVPASTLGLSPTDSQGFVIDAWTNRLRYSVSNNPSDSTSSPNFPFTSQPTATTGMKGVWANDPTKILPDLRVCSTGVGINSGDCATGQTLSNNAVAVVFSAGRNGGTQPIATNADELANWTDSGDRVFVNATPSATFDDIVTWLSPNILFNRMISAGRLP